MNRCSGKPLISFRRVSKYFKVGEEKLTIIRNVDLDIYNGEMVAIIGASGSGKSTLMNVLGCIDQPSSGTYYFAGRNVAELSPDEQAQLRCARFGFIFQRYELLHELDAIHNVELPAIYAGDPRRERRQRALKLLQHLGLGNRTDHRPNQLSGGQQQRVSIARAMMNGGEILLADEPTGALDSNSSAKLMELFHSLNRQGRTIIIVTHDRSVAAQANRVVEIKDGQIIADNRRVNRALHADFPSLHSTKAASWLQTTRIVEALRMAFMAMLSHWMRSLLTMLGIIIGTASVVLVVALGSGSQEKVLENINSLGTNTISIRAGTSLGTRWSGRIHSLVPSDVEALSQQPYSVGVSPEISNTVSVRFGATEVTASISGVSEDYFQIFPHEMVAGTPFDASDIDAFKQVAVIDTETRDTFFTENENPIGRVLYLGKVPVQVIGVFRSGGASFASSSLNIWLPYTTVISRISGQNHLSSIKVRIADTYDMSGAQKEINALILARHRKQDFFLQNSDTIRQAVKSTTWTMTLLIAAIAFISLLVGGIGLMNIMLVAVNERTREIGIRMAVGARSADIATQFLIESILIGILGCALGTIAALGIGCLIELLTEDIRVIFSVRSMIVAFASSLLIGVIFGLLPARSAAKLDPVLALNRN